MSDIQKSNDYRELDRFYPELLDYISIQYQNHPFPLFYEGKHNDQALDLLLDAAYDIWGKYFRTGEFSNFVTCFSESCDALTQWQAYADNANGCCIGFSLSALKNYCKKTNGVLRLEKVQYLSPVEFTDIMVDHAKCILSELNGLREWIVENMTHDDADPHTDGLLWFNFSSMLGQAFTDSLRYKSKDFSHEKEWRIFFADQAYKNTEWVLGEERKLLGPRGFSETLSFLRNKISFNITGNDIVPYFPIEFDDFKKCPVSTIWIGPKSQIRKEDILLYMKKNGYDNVDIKFSNISYR
jgi:hypothetical protein